MSNYTKRTIFQSNTDKIVYISMPHHYLSKNAMGCFK